MPKIELVSAVLVPFQGGRLVIPRRLALAAVLAAELQTFKVKITTAANPSYGAWREGEHDDSYSPWPWRAGWAPVRSRTVPLPYSSRHGPRH